ncbi:MAG: hypothetical protein JJ992_21775, partial [Planctomycetes bacterium]|nr:hypothetical protein [Planctomycetota bacterium]
MMRTSQPIVCVITVVLATGSSAFAEDLIDVPQVQGEWWQIAPNAPDVSSWSTGQENACDFAIVHSSDGK